jgi:hypothetical protein
MEEWMHWIAGYEKQEPKSTYDLLAELAVSSYDLDKKSRKADLKDKVQYFVKWWFSEKKKMKKYKSSTAIGKLLKKDHATILHCLHRRKPTIDFDFNTACIKDFLKS